MWFYRVILAMVVGASLLYGGSVEPAAVSSGPNPAGEANVQGPKKARELKSAPATGSPVRKITQLVEKIEGGVLYTREGRYSLSGLKVLDLTEDPGDVRMESMPKKIAEMTFLDNKLYEVVIRQKR
jgi:hypothetical protein